MTTPTSNPPPRAVADPADPGASTSGSGNAPAVEVSPRTNGAAGATAGAATVPPSGPPAGALAEPAAAPAPHRAHGPGHAGRHRPDPELAARYQARPRKRKRLLLLFPILLIALGAATLLGYRYWYETTYFVSTDNASVTGDLVQVSSLNAGRIVATRVDLGRPVREGQEIAVVAMPREVGSTAAGAAPKLGITGTDDSLVPVYSPLNGIVAARMGNVGGTVTAGQPIYALVDPAKVWIRANVEEASAWRVEVGQAAEIHVDALNRDFVGHVDAITPASAATFSLLPASNASGNFTKVTQYVPVKFVVDARGVVLPLGTSVEVRIRVREPGNELPLPWQP
jgi:multidrug resistance efflux pump